MSHPRRRHYRVAQKEVEAQVCQREGDHRRDSIFSVMLVIMLITEMLSLAIRIFTLFYSDDAER